MPKSEKQNAEIEQEKLEREQREIEEREQREKELAEEREREDQDKAERREREEQDTRRDEDRRQDEERRREEENRLREQRDQEDRQRQEYREREDREIEEQRRREDLERDDRRKREDDERVEEQKRAQEQLEKILRLQQEFERLRDQKVEQDKETQGSYGRSRLDDKIEAAERSMDETLAAVKRPDLEQAAKSNLERTEGSDLDKAHEALNLGRDIEESWSLEQRIGEEARQVEQADARTGGEDDREFDDLDQELNDLDRDDKELPEPARSEEGNKEPSNELSDNQTDSESVDPDAGADSSWLVFGEKQEDLAQQTVGEIERTDLPEWDKMAYEKEVIERTQDIQPAGRENHGDLEQAQVTQQMQQQQLFAEQNTLTSVMRREFLKEAKDRDGEEREDQEHEGR
jgi:hypothetical protein